MPSPLTVRTARGHLDTWDGETLGWLIVNADGAAAAATTMQFVSEVAGDELDGAGYARGDMDAVFEQVGEYGYLKRDPLFAVPATDTSAGDDPGGVWFYDKTGGTDAEKELISFLPAAPGPGFADWDVDPADGIAIVQLDTGDDGGGTVQSVVAGTNITVDSSDPQNPVVSAIAGDGVSVGAFVQDADLSGGSFTELVTFAGLTLARGDVVGASVLVYEGDDVGIWTVTASGPATPGIELVPAMPVTDRAGLVGVAGTLDGSTVAGVDVKASHGALAELTGVVGGLSDEIDEAAAAVEATGDAALLRSAAATYRATQDAPTVWAACGGGASGDPVITSRGYWSCSTVIPSPSDTLVIIGTMRAVARSQPGVDSGHFMEGMSETLDGTGINDRFEPALWDDEEGELLIFGEATEAGQTNEWWKRTDGQTLYTVAAPGIPRQTWVTGRWKWDFTAHTMTIAVENPGNWDFYSEGTHWQTVLTYENELIDSLAASTQTEWFVGRGGGWHDHARWRRWDDGVLVADFDPANATGPSTIPDAVLLDESEDPALWLAQDGSEVVEAPSTGGGPDLSDADPEDLGTADPGTSPDAARSDHVHDLPTAAAVGAVDVTLVDAKGDLIVATAADTPARLAVGADGTVPLANSNAAAGMGWYAPGSSHGFASGIYTPNAPFTSATVALVSDRLYACKPFLIRKRRTFDRIGLMHASGVSTTGLIRIDLAGITEVDGIIGAQVFGEWTIDPTSAASGSAVKAATVSITLDPGIYFPRVVANGITGTSPTVNARANDYPPIYPDAFTQGAGNSMPIQASVTGAIPTNWTPTASVNTSPVVYLRAT